MDRRRIVLALGLVSLLSSTGLAAPAAAQATPASMVDAYASLADVILSSRQAEVTLVRALLDGHRTAAETKFEAGDFEGAAAEIALFANEGDNAVGGVRKRLIEGGHAANPVGVQNGTYEPGYVVVTRTAKQAALEASANLRKATTDAERKAAWAAFAAAADGLATQE
jgi:hypothetical protein